MDIEKLIEQYMQAADKWEKRHPVTDTFDLRVQDALRDAATALSTLQAENEKLRAEVESLKKGHCAGCSIPAVKAEQIRDLTDAPKLRAELEQVKRERYVAIEYLREIEWCAGCKHFGGLDGCKKWAMGQCTEKHDLYEFVGPEKED